jgi:hypothetical protein
MLKCRIRQNVLGAAVYTDIVVTYREKLLEMVISFITVDKDGKFKKVFSSASSRVSLIVDSCGNDMVVSKGAFAMFSIDIEVTS